MSAAEVSEGAVRILAGLLEARTGQQLSVGRRWRIGIALNPLLGRFDLPTLDALAARVVSARDPALADAVVEALLNHETFFFRDAASFRQLGEAGLGRLHEARGDARTLRIWSAGCSTGQEAYSLAMLILDRPEQWEGWSIDIVATDLSAAAIAAARTGCYSQWEIQRGLPIARMLRWFEPAGEGWQARAPLRAMVRFRVHNLLEVAPAGDFDLVLCRNVLLYFSADVRRLVFGRIAGALAADGLLMLGAGETTMGQTDQFVSDYACRGLYRPRVAAPPIVACPGTAAARA